MKRRQLLWLMLAAAASAEVVRLGYFGEAQPFQVACARGWFDVGDAQVVCLPQSSGGFAVAKLDDGDLDVALLGSTPAATGLARGVAMHTFYVAHMKGTSQGLLVRPEIGSPLDMKDKTFGTPYGSTAHYHMLYIRTLFPDVGFNLINCNADCPDKYDAGTIDGAFVWGGVMEKMKARGTTMLAPAKLLSDWEKATFNTISVRDGFAADHSAVVERIAGVVARLDADYLNADSTRWSVDDSTGYLDSIAAAYKLLPGDSAQSLKKNRTAAADALALFEFVDPTDEDEGMRSCNFLGAAQTGCTGTAAALRETADFLYDIGNIASKAPPAGIADIDAFYVGTTTAQFLEAGLASVPASVLETTGAGVASIPTDADSDCSGTVDLTATTGTFTDGAATSYSNDLACEWRIASSGVVELSFDVFRVWAGDFVKVYDASNDLVAKLHGFDRAWPPLRTNGEMRVEFTTDGVTERALNVLTDGWSASYDAEALACAADHSTCGNGNCDTASGLCICDAGYGGGDCSLATCLGTTTLTSPTGEFRSSPTAPDSTAPYPNGAECHFVADVGASFGYVSFTITYDVEPTFDFVTVKSGDETWARLSGADTATILVPTTDGKAELVFTSDPQGRRGGFTATYVGTDDGCGEDGLCGGHGTCEGGGKCVCDAGYGGLACTVPHCLDRARAVTDKSSMVMVSQAEGDVPAAASCDWEFQPAAGETIRVVVDTLNLEPYDGLKGDRLLIQNAGNSTEVQIQTEATYEISSSSVSLTLKTDRNDVLLPGEAPYDGFSATAYSVAACPDLRGGDCEDEGFTCEDGYCYDLSGGSKRASGCTCAGCDVGSYLDDATGSCEACPAGTYQPQAKNTVGASSCIACSAGMDAPEPGSALCCSEDYVLVGQKCAKCGVDDGDYKLTGTKCDTPETRTVATLEIEKGFFRFSPAATVVYPCPEKDDACGGWDPSKLVDSEDEYYGDRFCRDNAEGPLCLHCKKGFFRSKGDKSECKSCDSHGQLALQLVATVVLIAAWFAVLFGVKALRTRFHRDWFEAVAIQFVFFFVTMSRFVGIHQITLPDPLFRYMWALDFISLDLTSIQSVLRCGSKVTYFDFLLFWTLLAPALVVVVVVFAILRGLVTVYVRGPGVEEAGAPPDPAVTDSRRGEARFVSDRELEDEEQLTPVQRVALSVQRDLDAGLMVVFAVLTMFHSGICSTIFNTFNCSINYTIDDGQGSRGLRYLAADYTISCSTDYVKRPRAPAEYDAYYDDDSADDHAFYETYATIALVVYAVGVPLAYLAWMLRARRLARDEQRPVDDGALAFLTRSVKPEFWWFEVAALVARSLVTGMLLFVDTKDATGVSLIMSFFVIVVHRTLVLQFRPYASTGLQLVVEALMRATFSIALMAVAVYGSDPILGEKTASVVAILVFALNISVLPFAYRAWRTESYRSVWKSTSVSGAPDNSSLSHFSTMTRPC